MQPPQESRSSSCCKGSLECAAPPHLHVTWRPRCKNCLPKFSVGSVFLFLSAARRTRRKRKSRFPACPKRCEASITDHCRDQACGGLAETETEYVFERCMRPGAARGPPGTTGAVGSGASRADVVAACGLERDAASAGGRFVSTLLGDCWLAASPERPFSLRTLVLRPSDAKKPVPVLFVPGKMASVFVGEESSVEVRVEVREMFACASAGYGRAGGGAVDGSMSMGRIERSVAVYASARMGNVACEASEPCETCLPCGGMPPSSAGSGAWSVLRAVRCDCVLGCEPIYVTLRFNMIVSS